MVGIVGRVGDDMIDPFKPHDQTPRLRTVPPLAGCDRIADRHPEPIDTDMDLGGQPAARPADRVSFKPPF
jgi:hypothetical protein